MNDEKIEVFAAMQGQLADLVVRYVKDPRIIQALVSELREQSVSTPAEKPWQVTITGWWPGFRVHLSRIGDAMRDSKVAVQCSIVPSADLHQGAIDDGNLAESIRGAVAWVEEQTHLRLGAQGTEATKSIEAIEEGDRDGD